MGQIVLARVRLALSRRGRSALLALLCLLCVAALRLPGAGAQERPDPSGAAVSHVVFGIISYTRWPVEPTDLHLCVVPPTAYADALEHAAAQSSGRPIHIEYISADDGLPGTTCNVVYFGAVSNTVRTAVIDKLDGHPILTISEHDDDCSVGSVFCLAIRDNQVSFKVNLDSLARSGVRVHPSVLQLAHGNGTRP